MQLNRVADRSQLGPEPASCDQQFDHVRIPSGSGIARMGDTQHVVIHQRDRSERRRLAQSRGVFGNGV